MNGYWYPWSEQRNGNQPGDYVKAWRHVVDIFRSVGATNATWVWCVNTPDHITTPLTELYPGDNYVDWTAIDGYNKATDPRPGSRSTRSLVSIPGAAQHLPGTGESGAIQANHDRRDGHQHTGRRSRGMDQRPPADATATELPAGEGTGLVQLKAIPISVTPSRSTWNQESSFRQGIGSSYYAANSYSSLPGGPVKPIGPPASPQGNGTSTVTLKDVGDTYVDSRYPWSTGGGPSLPSCPTAVRT